MFEFSTGAKISLPLQKNATIDPCQDLRFNFCAASVCQLSELYILVIANSLCYTNFEDIKRNDVGVQ